MSDPSAQSARNARDFRAALLTGVLSASLTLAACGGGGAPPGPGPLSITTTSLPDGITQTAYGQVLNVTGGERPYTWQIATENLPTGVELSTNGRLAGTPTEAGLFQFTVQVTDAGSRSSSRSLTLRVVERLVVTSASEALLWLNEPYSQTLEAAGGTKPYRWSTTGDLPPGVTLSPEGVLNGTPTENWHWVFQVHLSDSGPPLQTLSQVFDVFVYKRLQITTSQLPAGRIGLLYRAGIGIEGNMAAHNYIRTITSGFLPTGLAFDFSTGDLTGVPNAEGTFDFTMEVTEAQKPFQTVSRALSLTISSDLGRNDTPATATPISNGTIRASISPYADPVAGPANPDHDFYALTASPGAVVKLETRAKRLFPASPLDTVLEIVDAAGARLETCRFFEWETYNLPCLNDDIELGIVQDSRLELKIPESATEPMTFYVRVSSWDGNARPEYIYELTVSGAN